MFLRDLNALVNMCSEVREWLVLELETLLAILLKQKLKRQNTPFGN
jgi:hypothetical protein